MIPGTPLNILRPNLIDAQIELVARSGGLDVPPPLLSSNSDSVQVDTRSDTSRPTIETTLRRSAPADHAVLAKPNRFVANCCAPQGKKSTN
jgi:hypothetical protein